jgi:predicted PurR-regulated permease PerM
MSESVRRPELAWWVVGLALGAVLVWAAYLNIGVIMLAVFIYYATRPLLRRVRRVIPSSSLSALVSLALFVLPALLVSGYTVNVAVHELYNVVELYGAGNIQPYIEPYVSQGSTAPDWRLLLTSPGEFFSTNSGVSFAQGLFGYALSSLSFIGSVTINLALVLILAFYFLRDDARISRWFYTHLGVYLPQWDVYAREVDEDISTIFFGNILHAVITAVIAVTVYTGISVFNPTNIPVPYPALVGLLCGIASLIPMVGTKLVYVPVGAYMGAWGYSVGGQSELVFPLSFIAASYIIVDTIPDVVIRPYVSAKRIHMGLVMLAYIIGPTLFGWYGLFLGPALLVLGLHFLSHILPHLLEPGAKGFENGDRTVVDMFLERDDNGDEVGEDISNEDDVLAAHESDAEDVSHD